MLRPEQFSGSSCFLATDRVLRCSVAPIFFVFGGAAPLKMLFPKKGSLLGVWLQGLSPQGSGHPGRGDSSLERHASTKVDTHLRRPAFAPVAATPRCPCSWPFWLLCVLGLLRCGFGSLTC